MKRTLNIDEALLKRAAELTGIEEEDALVDAGLKALVARLSTLRLAKLMGTQERLAPIPQRRPGEI